MIPSKASRFSAAVVLVFFAVSYLLAQNVAAGEDANYYLSNARNRLRNEDYRINDMKGLYPLDKAACKSCITEILLDEGEKPTLRRKALELFWSLDKATAGEFCKKVASSADKSRNVRIVMLDFLISQGVFEEKELWKIAEDRKEDVTIRNRVLAELLVRNHDETVKVVRKIIKDPMENSKIRAILLNLLVGEDDSEIPEIIISILKDPDEDTEAKAAVMALAAFKGYTAVTPTILRLLNDSSFADWRLKASALETLKTIGDEKIIPELKRLAQNETGEIQKKHFEAVIAVIEARDEEDKK
ncbi:MAG: HEAT repeat domain-containing protein [Candidatus Omnitrophica bacterium]|nr:HEAT repeat domain-containing protein [Candidatus Omnitrophota bacterium]